MGKVIGEQLNVKSCNTTYKYGKRKDKSGWAPVIIEGLTKVKRD